MTARQPRPVLTTRRLELVPLAEEHLELEIELDSDPEVLRYLSPRAQTSFEVERAHRRRLAAADEVPGLGFRKGDRFSQTTWRWTSAR
jgi:hypothetical protein